MGNSNETQKQAASPTNSTDKQVTGAHNQNTTNGSGPSVGQEKFTNVKSYDDSNFDSKDLIGNFVSEENRAHNYGIEKYFGNEKTIMLSSLDGAPPERFERDKQGKLTYTEEVHSGPFSTDDKSLHLSDPYGAPRKNGAMHGGIDLATNGKTGIDVLSLTDGVVYRVGATGFGPHSVTVLSQGGTYFTYGHLASNFVSLNSHVKIGEPLGEIGSLGISTGIHVHIQATRGAAFGPSRKFVGIEFP